MRESKLARTGSNTQVRHRPIANDSGRPSSVIRLSTLHASTDSSSCAARVRPRSRSPRIDLYRKKAFSTRAWRRPHPGRAPRARPESSALRGPRGRRAEGRRVSVGSAEALSLTRVLATDRGRGPPRRHGVGSRYRPSHSRSGVSKDNPFSESKCWILKYRPAFPDRFSGARTCPRHVPEFARTSAHRGGWNHGVRWIPRSPHP